MTRPIPGPPVQMDAPLPAAWARVGAAFNVDPAAQTPDLERLLLSTARAGRREARLFIMAATWLAAYGRTVAKHRLRRLVRDELDAADAATLGLMLELAADAGPKRGPSFRRVIETCRDVARRGGHFDGPACPLFDVYDTHAAARRRLEREATDVARSWNWLAPPMDLKPDALRRPGWVVRTNPLLGRRADMRGDLRSSILATLRNDPAAGKSESALARACGVTRAGLRSALERLILAGHVVTRAEGRRKVIELAPA